MPDNKKKASQWFDEDAASTAVAAPAEETNKKKAEDWFDATPAPDEDFTPQVSDAISKYVPATQRDLVLAQLKHETGNEKLNSNVSRSNNNFSGITWNSNFPAEWKGSPRPKSEGGYYVNFPSVDDWAKEHVKLLQKDSGAGAPIDATTVEDYAHRLKKNGYYTAPEETYVAGLKNMLPGQSESSAAEQPYAWEGTSTQAASPAPVVSSGSATPVYNAQQAVDASKGKFRPEDQEESTSAVINNTAAASKVLMDDIVSNLHDLPPAYKQNMDNVPFTEKGNIVHDITDPHGDPSMTGGYVQTRLAQLRRDHTEQAAQIKARMQADPTVSSAELADADVKFYTKERDLKESTGHIIDLQLANRAVQDKSFDAVRIGMERQKLMGDKKAEQDLAALNNGKPISPDARVHYQSIGLAVLMRGKDNAQANGQEGVADVIGGHSDDPEKRLEKDNPEYFRVQRTQAIGDEIYRNENALYGTLFSKETPSEDEISKAGKKLGFTKAQIADIKPEDIPTASSIYGQAAQGFVNTLGAPLYEAGMRGLVYMGIADKQAVDQRFKPGWEHEEGFGTAFTGKMPQTQEELSIHHPVSVIGAMAKGVGDIAGFLTGGEAVKGFLGATELVTDAVKANKIANFATAALPAYNSAYEKSVQTIGDKPEDEWKRQLYSTTNGIIGGAVMMLDPKADIARDIIGETKAGASFINELKKGGVEGLTRDAMKNKFAQMAIETGKHVGLQIGMAEAATIGENVTDMMLDPQGKHDVTDNTVNAATQAAVGMFLPSMLAGIQHPLQQSSLNRSIVWDVGSNSRRYRNEVNSLYKQGKITRDELFATNNAINSISHIVKTEVPFQSVANGKELTPDQQQQYAWNLLVEHQIDNQLHSIPETDKAQRSVLEQKKKEFESKRGDILTNAGEKPKYERPKLLTEVPEKKDEEKLAEEKNKNVPLRSSSDNEVSSTQKTEQNETISRQEGRQDRTEGSETKGRGQDTEVRQTAGVQERGNKDPVGVEVKDTEATPEAGQPLSVSKKSRKKYKWTTEESDPGHAPIITTDALQTQDLGEAKGKPEEETGADIKKTTVSAPEKPADALISDEPTGESFNDAKQRVSDAIGEITKPEAKGGAKDNTLVVAHSWVIKLLKSAYNKETGTFDFNKEDIAKAHQAQSTEVGNRYEFKIKDADGNERNLIVARHGETEANLKDQQRPDNTPLTAEGRKEAEQIAAELKKEGKEPPAIIASDLPRAQETAHIIQEALRSHEQIQKKIDNIQGKKTALIKDLGPDLGVSKRLIEKYDAQIASLEKEKANQGTEPSPERRNEVSSEKEVPAAKEKPKRNQHKKGYSITRQVERRERVFKNEPQSMEEYILQTMLGMHDKEPERMWSLSSIAKDIPGGDKVKIVNGKEVRGSALERERVKRYASEHPNAIPVDVWASDIVNQAGERGTELNFQVPDEQEIRNMVIENISRFNNKTELLEHLEDLYSERAKKEHDAENARYEKIPVGIDAEGKEVFDYRKKSDEPTEHELAQMYAGKKGEDFEGYSDEGHPVYQHIAALYDDIDETKLTPEDETKIIDFYRNHFDEKTGEVDYDKAHTDHEGLNALRKEVSESAQKLLDHIVPFFNFEEHHATIQRLIKKATEYEKQSREARLEGGDKEADTERQGPTEGRGAPPESQSAGAGKTSESKAYLDAIDKTKKGGISNDELQSEIRKANDLRDKAKKLENSSDVESQSKRYDLLDRATKIQEEATSKIAPFEKVVDTTDEMLNLKSQKVNETKCRELSKKHQEEYGGEYKEVQVTNADGSRVTHAIVAHGDYVYEPQSDALINKKVFDDFFNTNVSEKPNPTPNDERSVATDLQPEDKTSATEKRLAEIEEDLIKQHASQKLEASLRAKAEKEKDIPAANKHNENYYKKQDRIDKLLAEKEQLLEEGRIKEKYATFADKIRDVGNKLVKKGDIVGSMPGISPKLVKEFINRVADLVEKVGNIHVAIHRALEWYKGAGEKEPTEAEINEIKDNLNFLRPQVDKEPALSISNEESAKDLIADIKKGDLTFEEATQDIMEESGIPDKTKGKILDYVEWHLKDRGLRSWNLFPKEEGVDATEDDNKTTSIKNDITRLRRAQYGLNEEFPAAHKAFGETWDEAKSAIEKGYDPQNLIDELAKHPRPVTDVENAILLHQQNTREIELMGIHDHINQAAEQGDKYALAQYRTTKARLLDELQRIYDVNKAVGTENARGLAARRMMVDRKYDLVNMLAEKRATANEGEPLSEEQVKHVEELHKKIKETQDAFDNYVKQAESQIIDLQEKVLNGKVKDKKTASAKLREWAGKIEQANKNTAYSSPIPITPKMVAEALRVIAAGVEKGEQLVDLVRQGIEAIKKDNPGIDERHLEREINKNLIDSGILEPTADTKKAKDMSGLYADGRLDREAVRLRVEADRAKAEYDISLKKDEQAKLSKLATAQNWFIKWERMGKLSNPITMGKLAMAGLTRLTTTPLEDIVGGAYSALMPRLAKGAIGEGGGLNVAETARAYKTGIMVGLKDSREIMSKGSHGKSELDVLYGKAGDLPPEAIDFFGQLHSATKAPIKRILFERSLEKRIRRNLANGVDVSDPMVQTSIMIDAYKDANRAIFMQDNKVAEGWQKMIRYLEKPDKQTGKAPARGIATGLQWLVPFVKVPTNIAAEIGTHVYGLPVAAGKLLHAAFTNGVDKLTEQERDVIFRNLKKGSLGAAALALGYFNPQNFGGFYQQGQKRKEDDAEALGLKLFDQKIPAWFIEAPIFQAMQLGATVRRVKDELVHGEEKGIGEGVWAGALGLVQHVPMIEQPMRMNALFKSPKEREYYLGELAKSTVVPALITYLAKVTDPADEGSPLRKALAPENKRATPRTMVDHIKSGLPYFREDLPEK